AGDAPQTLTYADAERGSAQVAALLRALGVRRGDRVAVQVDKSPASLVAYLGVVRAGAVLLPMNPAYRPDEVGYLLRDAEPAVAIGRPGDTDFAQAARGARVRHLFDLDAFGRGSWADAVDAADGSTFSGDAPPIADDDLAAIVYTSGTTGRSKGAMLSHRNLVSNARALHEIWRFQPGDVLIHALPTFHVHGLFVATNTAMLNASTILLHRRFDPAVVVADLARSTVFMGVPTMYVRLLTEPGLTHEQCGGMRLFVSGSAPLHLDTFERFRARTGHTILERYGMTETSMITSNPCDGVRKGGTVGLPLPGVEVRVVDEHDAEQVAGAVGDVQVRGPNVLRGYWRQPDRTAADFTPDGWFRTGDVGVFDDDGYLTLVGRSKDLVITGGYNVYPKEIELLLDEVPGVVESAVIGVPHPEFGEGVTAVVVVEPGRTIDTVALIAALREHLAAYKAPKAVITVDELPRNAMGKVQKNLLRERLKNLYDTFSEPTS
ncbi:MAG TPA: AMP-binding protein, partial [Acidimicrobiales bacterium]